MKFSLIVADNPWMFSDHLIMSSTKRGAASHYPTIAAEDLCKLEVKDIIADNAILALWCPSSMLENGLTVGRYWGFDKFSTIWTWVKRNPSGLLAFGMGHTFRGSTEHALIFRRGKKIMPKEHRRNVYIGPPLNYSQKPEALQDDLDVMYPEGERLELFARRWRDGWDTTGLELDGRDVREALAMLKVC